jgi:Ca2+-transporting ATPase
VLGLVILLESIYEVDGVATAATVGFVAFALLSVAMGLSARSETATAFNRDVIHDRTQLLLYGLALLLTFLATELAALQRILGLTELSVNQWLICIACTIALLLVDEVIKIFLRRGTKKDALPETPSAPVLEEAS